LALATATTGPGDEVVNWDIDKLKPYPKQADWFEDLSGANLRALADDINKNGLLIPPEILPDGTLITGHQRVRACRLLGGKQIPVRVRHDLAQAGEVAVELRFLTDNLNRRHTDPLGQARCYQRQLELEKTKGKRKLFDREAGDIRDRVAKRLDCGSGRTLSRLLKVLETPLEVQRAFSRGELGVLLAGKVAGLKKDQQAAIAEAIRQGGNPKEVVTRYLPAKTAGHKSVRSARDAFVRSLRGGLEDLEGRVEKIKSLTLDQEEVLQQGLEVIQQILNQAQVVDPMEQQANLEKQLEAIKMMRTAKPDIVSGISTVRSAACA
jgi:ParB family chromosome partitioning protein